MKTKLLYVLVSSPADLYLEQALVSVTSARMRNPGACIELLTDTATGDGLAARGHEGEDFLKLFDKVTAVPLDPSLPAMKRSRLLKTGMRRYVEGDFLYIDTDTIVARPLDDIDGITAELAACADLHCLFAEHPHRSATISLCRRAGADVSKEQTYFNGGVMLVRDTPLASEFFRMWEQYYLESYPCGIRQDQPSLARACIALSHPVAELKGFWNCQLQHGVRFLKDAYIVHYVCTNISTGEEGRLFALNDKKILLKVREEGIPAVKQIIDDPFCGIAPCTFLSAGDDLHFFRTRRYRFMRRHYRKGRFSITEFALKVCDHLKPRTK